MPSAIQMMSDYTHSLMKREAFLVQVLHDISSGIVQDAQLHAHKALKQLDSDPEYTKPEWTYDQPKGHDDVRPGTPAQADSPSSAASGDATSNMGTLEGR